ncbi:MAG: carbonic anhydrase [Defluviitaleaceae bacterium]|nr:carbonic anhydrase [Defluviitaleaceae bacterium]MCL2273963.1 carbonic anhydrase [Defluviitaleaceae bacterium]
MRSSQVTPITDPKVALQALKDGNKRFIDGAPTAKDDTKDRKETVDTQKPFAIVLTCADSRCSPEIFFDTKIGDLFVLRNAGNFATDVELGSMEFATAVLGAPLAVVIGHSACGAVNAAFDKAEGLPEKLHGVIENLKPGIAGCGDKLAAYKANVETVVKNVKDNPIIQKQNTMVVGAYYDFASGEVKFFE